MPEEIDAKAVQRLLHPTADDLKQMNDCLLEQLAAIEDGFKRLHEASVGLVRAVEPLVGDSPAGFRAYDPVAVQAAVNRIGSLEGEFYKGGLLATDSAIVGDL